MNQPLHNNAIPANPAIKAQLEAANTAAEPVAPAQAPIEPTTPSNSQSELWDAFDAPQAAAPSPPPPELPPAPTIQSPSPPPMPPEMPPSVDELLGGASAPVRASEPAPAPVQPQAPMPTPPPFNVEEMQKRAIDYLMANEYKLSDEDRTHLISAPDEVLPRLAARMHIGIATQLAQQVAQAVPAMIQQHMESHVKAQRAEMEFFSKYPKLNRDEWKPVIAESLQMVKSMNPHATRDQIIAEGAALAAFRINSKFGNRNVPQPPQQPRSVAQPYVPVATGGGMTPPTNPNQVPNIWEDLGNQDWNTW